jgi:hypothetical protein
MAILIAVAEMRLKNLLLTAFCSLALIFGAFGYDVPTEAKVPTSSQSQDSSTPPRTENLMPTTLENLAVTVTGLKETDVATITLLPETAPTDSVPILRRVMTGEGNGDNNTVDMSGTLFHLSPTPPSCRDCGVFRPLSVKLARHPRRDVFPACATGNV